MGISVVGFEYAGGCGMRGVELETVNRAASILGVFQLFVVHIRSGTFVRQALIENIQLEALAFMGVS